jgi:hypothetical protein
MKLLNTILSTVVILTSMQTFAQNDVYGTVGDMYYRQGVSVTSEEDQVYFRMNVSSGTPESCMTNGTDITWYVDLNSVNADKVIALLEKSRNEMKEIRVLGRDNICTTGQATESDFIFEVMPNWNPAG